MRTLTAYGIGVVIVLAILNGIAWLVGSPRLHGLNVFSAGFVLGMLGTCISAYLNGYRKVAMFDIDCRSSYGVQALRGHLGPPQPESCSQKK